VSTGTESPDRREFFKAMNPKMTSNLVKARPRGDLDCEWVELQD
jgi:hypothetical protein